MYALALHDKLTTVLSALLVFIITYSTTTPPSTIPFTIVAFYFGLVSSAFELLFVASLKRYCLCINFQKLIQYKVTFSYIEFIDFKKVKISYKFIECIWWWEGEGEKSHPNPTGRRKGKVKKAIKHLK